MKLSNLDCTTCCYCEEIVDDGTKLVEYQCNLKPPVWTGKRWEQPPVFEFTWCGEHPEFERR